MNLQYGNGFIGILMVLLFSLGLLIPLIVISVTGLPSHQVMIGGRPIADSVFNEISSQVQNEAMFPGGAAESTTDGIRMVRDYSQLERVSESVAVESVLQFANQSSYLMNQSLTLDAGWTRLDPTYWTLRFFGPSVEVYGAVNAFSGKVIAFHIAWQGPSPYIREYNGTAPLSETEVEAHALMFLENNNYTLDQHSRYLGPQIENGTMYLSDYVYTLRFFDIINETMVWGNVVELDLDIETGELVSFRYDWTFISSINTQRSMSSPEAESVALDYIREMDRPVVAFIESSVLLLSDTHVDSSADYRLIWAVSVNSESIGAVWLDATDGEVLSVWEYVLASPILHSYTSQWTLVALVVFPPLVVGLAAFALARRRAWKGLPELKTPTETEET